MRFLEEDAGELEMLLTLDSRVRKTLPATYCQRPVQYDTYTERQIELSELLSLVQIVQENPRFALEPINTDMGFSVGFSVVYAPPNSTAEALHVANPSRSVLRFVEKQLPHGHSFATLAPYFMADANIQKLTAAGCERPTNERSRYDY